MSDLDDILKVATQDALEDVSVEGTIRETVVINIHEEYKFMNLYCVGLGRLLDLHPSLHIIKKENVHNTIYYYTIEKLTTLHDVTLLLKIVANIYMKEPFIFQIRDKRTSAKPSAYISSNILRVLFRNTEVPNERIDESKSCISNIISVYNLLYSYPLTTKDVEEELLKYHLLDLIVLSETKDISETNAIKKIYRPFKKTDTPVYKEFETSRFNYLTGTRLANELIILNETFPKKKYMFLKESVVYKIVNRLYFYIYSIMWLKENKTGDNYYILKEISQVNRSNIFPVSLAALKPDVDFVINLVEKVGSVDVDYKRKDLKKIFK